ncbi:hypothetical protein [Umezawaea sp. Da 62-37]|uniref:hypothetical protein n=1 Tax=Umezawaea sp. Da 62-37 TaxID=3075927 RepID=UPI0028F73117|nr:hypothetical protein [Umezawaea sp. Da 62-37]WNV84825.1 hypothetical protein RM788_42790 [Umezawaea sp. Da 62-37]
MVESRPGQLLVRITPALSFLVLWRLLYDLLRLLDGGSDREFTHRMDDGWFAAGYGVALASLVLLPATAAWSAAIWVRHRTQDRKGTATAVIASGLYVALWPVIDGVGVVLALGGLVTVLVLVVLVYLGVDSVVGWALRTALRQVRALGTMTSKALPLLLLFTTFGFFTNEVWQVAGSLTRQRLWLVIGLFVLVGLFYMFSVLSDELRALGSHQRDPIEPDWWRTTPFDAPAVGSERIALRRSEKANMVVVLLLAQLVQVLVFSLLMFAFFVAFGLISLRPEVMASWIGHTPGVGSLFGVDLPVPDELLQVSLFLAAFSGMYFVTTTVIDARYRDAFLDPLVDHLAVSLAAREVYLRSTR